MAEQQLDWRGHLDAGQRDQRRARWDGAEEHFRTALALAEKEGSDGQEGLHESLLALAGFFAYRSRDREALPVALRLLDLQEQILGPTHSDLIATLTLLGDLSGIAITRAQSQVWARRALGIAEQAWGMASPEIVSTLRCLALSLWRTRQYAESEEYWLRALEILERHAVSTPWCANYLPAALSCLSLTYWMSGQWEKMESAKRRELALARERGEDELTVAKLIRDIGSACKEQGKFLEAEAAFIECFPMYEHWFRSTVNARRFRRPHTRGTARSLRAGGAMERGCILVAHAEVREALGDVAGGRAMNLRAWRNIRSALRYHESRGRADDIGVVRELSSLADLSQTLGRHRYAAEYYERLLGIYERMFDDEITTCAPEVRSEVVARYRGEIEGIISRYSPSLTHLGRADELETLQKRLLIIR